MPQPPYNYYLALYESVMDEPGGVGMYSRTPVGTEGSIDMRPDPDQELEDARDGSNPYAFICTKETLGQEHIFLGNGDLREMPYTSMMQDKWNDALGCRPEGATLADALMHATTDLADPTGQEFVRPNMPRIDGSLGLELEGHSQIGKREFDYNSNRPVDRAYLKIFNKVIHDQYRQRLADVENEISLPEHHLRCLDYTRHQLGIRSNDRINILRLVPQEHRNSLPDKIPRHKTTLTESFPTISTDLTTGQDNVWTETDGDLEVVTGNRLSEVGRNGAGEARLEVDLSSSAHSNEAELLDTDQGGSDQFRLFVRFSSSARDGFLIIRQIDRLRAFKITAGVLAGIGTDFTGLAEPVNGVKIKVQMDADQYQSFENGILRHTISDFSHPSNTRVGAGLNFNSQLKNIFAQDLELAVQNDIMVKSLGGPLATVMAGRGDRRNMVKSLSGPVLNL